MKTCALCKIEQPESNFVKSKRSKDGLYYRCKNCCKQYRLKNKDILKQKTKEYCAKTEVIQHRKEYHKQWCKLNLRDRKEYYVKNREKIRKQQKVWNSTNKQKRNQYSKNKKQQDPAYKLISNLRTRVSNLIRGKIKTIRTTDSLGCTKEQLLKHIQDQWEPGMSWDNYGNKPGQWSIDHIKPFCLIDSNDTEAIINNNHYTNLRPMWHLDNISRKYEDLQ